MSSIERAHAVARMGAAFVHGARAVEQMHADGIYLADYWMPAEARRDEVTALRLRLAEISADAMLRRAHADEIDAIRLRLADIPRELVWRDVIHNLVTTEGKNAALTHMLKGSAYTASQALGLIEDTGYSAIAAGNTAGSITAVGGGSPANGWNEAPSATVATRGTPSFGTASGGSLATSAAVSFSTLASDTIKGAFLLVRSAAGTAPSTSVGNTSGALLSAGLFSGGDQAVTSSGTLNVTYSLGL
jgi:hypothetical protein